MKKNTFILIVSLFAVSNIANAANKNEAAASSAGSGKKIVKWVDSSGMTHYGDKLPAQEAGRNNAEMNTQGVVLKRNVVIDKNSQALDQQKIERNRKDGILLASYTKPEEIDLARDRNLQMDQAAIQALISQKESVASRLARNNKTAENIRARNKPLPPYLRDELKLSQAESARIDKQIAERNLSIEATRKHFAQEKARFVALKQPASNSSGTVSLDAIITENPTATGASSSEQTTKK